MNDQQITAQVLPNEELIGKLCTMYSLYPLEKMTTVLWKEAVSRLESNDSRIAALEAQNARLVEALSGIIEIGKRDMTN